MRDTRSSWSCLHFSLANKRGRDQEDVPRLLRRVAKAIDDLGEVEVQDIVFHQEVEEGRNWPSVTVYFQERTRGDSR